MKPKFAKILIMLLCLTMILQGGFVMPVFADGDYSCYVHYMIGPTRINDNILGDIVSAEHPVIIPPGTSDEEIVNQLQSNTEKGSVNVGDTINIEEPFRVMGYKFDGWYYGLNFSRPDPFVTAKKFTGTVTSDMASDINMINLYAKWSLYDTPDVTSDSVNFVLQNDVGEYINEPIMWTDKDGNGSSGDINFDSDVTDYYGYVYGDVSKLKISFEQYDPGRVERIIEHDDREPEYVYENHAYSELIFNGAEEAITAEDITIGDRANDGGEYHAILGYHLDTDTSEYKIQYVNNDQSVVAGFNYTSDNYLNLIYTKGYTNTEVTELPDENIISVTVHMPEYLNDLTGEYINNTKTYNFHIKRLDMTIKPAYGNTPFGRIMDTYTDAARQNLLKEQFRQSYTFNRHTYSPSAWNIYGENGVQAVIGTQLKENEYINYDEDETAIVVAEGTVFNDPGVSLYINGARVDNVDVKRTIHYTTINSLRYPNWHSDDNEETDKIQTDIISSDEVAPVNILKDEEYVKPGIYTIDYEYTPAGMGASIKAHRTMIVMPKQDPVRPYHFDINMDNFINALDTLIYDIKPEADKYIIDNVYLYRVLDVNEDGVVDDKDKNTVMQGTSIFQNIYPPISVEDVADNTPSDEYIASGIEEDGKVHLYMDFLGTDVNKIANMTASEAAKIEKTPLKEGDIFYIGYRFTGVENLTAEEKSALLNEITLSTSYDSRYISPARTGSSALMQFLSLYDKHLYDAKGESLFDIVYTRNSYTVDKSTAFEKWNNIGDAGDDDLTRIAGYNASNAGDTSAVRTMRLEMYLKQNKEYTLKNNEYLLKIPMRVDHIPPSQEEYTTHDGQDITRRIISVQLGANSLNMALGRDGYGYMWDMSDEAINIFVTKNLKDKLQYMGSFVPVFAEEKDPIVINATYKETLPNGLTVSAGIFEGHLPPGVTYEAGRLKGSPEHAGDYEFYVNGVRYKMHVNKRQITVIAEDKELIYGNPITDDFYTYKFNEAELAEGDTVDCDLFQEGLKKAVLTCSATSDAVNGYSEVGTYDIKISLEDSVNYTFVPQKGTLKIVQRPICVTQILKDIPDYIGSGSSVDFTSAVLYDNATYFENGFEARNGDIMSGDDIRITYNVKYTGYKNAANKTCYVQIINIRITGTYGRGKNYTIDDSQPALNTEGKIVDAQVVDFAIASMPDLVFTYGDKIDLNIGQIYIRMRTADETGASGSTYKETDTIVSLATAQSIGLKLTFDRENGPAVTSEYMPVVADTGRQIYITCPDGVGDAQYTVQRTSGMTVHPMPITVRADNRERYYGDPNDASHLRDPETGTNADFSYQIVPNSDGSTGRIVTEFGDTQSGILTNYISYSAVPANTEIRQEDIASNGRGSTLTPINMTYSGTNQNYAVTIADAYSQDTPSGSSLTIQQRPITIDKLTAPALKATDYIRSDGTKYSPSRDIEGFAVAGKKAGVAVTEDGALDVTLANGSLYNDDPIKMDYTVQYIDASTNYNEPYNIVSNPYGMDVSYEKSRNYYIKEIKSFTGSKEIRRISDIRVIRQPQTTYIFGEDFDLSLGEHMDGINENDYTRTGGADPDDSWIRITYDTGEVSDISFADLCRDYADNEEYYDNLTLTIKIDDGESATLNKAFMDGFNKNDEDKHFNVKDSGKIKIALKAKNVIDGDTRKTKPNQENYAWEWAVNVEKREINVKADDKATTFDRTTFPDQYSVTFDEDNFAWGQNSSLVTDIRYTCMEDNNIIPASTYTPAGLYTIKVEVPDTDNYTFKCSAGTLTVRQKPLIITNIDIPALSAKDAEEKKLSVSVKSLWTGEDNVGLTFADGYEPFDDETIEITYTYTYLDNPRAGGEVDVAISGIAITRTVGEARNYYIQSAPATVKGEVIPAYISSLEVSKIMGKDSEGNDEEKTYVYGDTLDLSGTTFTIHYNSGGKEEIDNIDDLADFGVKIDYYKKDSETNEEVKQTEPIEDGIFLTRDYDGMYIKMSLTEDNENLGNSVEPADSENSLQIGKRPIVILVNNSSYTYGDNPPSTVEYGAQAKDGVYTYTLRESDFPETEEKTKEQFHDELLDGDDYVPPTISALTDSGNGAAPDNTTDATTVSDIRITADASSASSDNYTFVSSSFGLLTVNKRKISVSDIAPASIPMLTADVVFQNNNQPPITVSSDTIEVIAGQTEKMTVDGIVNGDTLGFLLDVIYDTVEDTREGTTEVRIAGIKLTDDDTTYPKLKNYVLDTENFPETADGGRVRTRRITDIIIEKHPVYEYTYGEILKIADSVVAIKYTSGEGDTDRVPITLLPEYDVNISFVDEDGNELSELGAVEENKLLTVNGFNGVRIKIAPFDNSQVINNEEMVRYTNPIVVSPKRLRLEADDMSMTYGDSVPTLGWHYNENDLENGDSLTSDRFTVDNADFTSYDSENHLDYLYVDETITSDGSVLPADRYSVKWKDVPSDKKDNTANYTIIYEDGSLTVEKKELRISDIWNVPALTPALIAANNSTVPVTVPAKKVWSSIVTDNFGFEEGYAPIDGDEIEISYNAVYNDMTAGPATADIGNVTIAASDIYESNKNYFIGLAPTSADGTVVEKSIATVEILSDPVMRDDDRTLPIEYKYTDSLMLDRGSIRITYDNGIVIDNISFVDIEDASEGKITLTYSDDDGNDISGEQPPADGQMLYVSKHNGKHIKLNVDDDDAVFKYMGSETAVLQTGAIKVNKAPITTTVFTTADERIYGDENPDFYCEYSGFINGDDIDSENFAENLVEPQILCEADIKAPVGEDYRVYADGGESPNYYFVSVDAEIDVTPRILDVRNIIGGVPALTSKIIREQPGDVHVLRGYALNSVGQLVLENLSEGDVVRISYDAIYTSVEPEMRNITVAIENVQIEDYEQGKNYILRDVPDTAYGGNIYTKKIADVVIAKQPKLEYTYGEDIDLAEPGVSINYDDGEVVTGIPYDQLDLYDIALYITYMDEDGNEVTEPAMDLYERQRQHREDGITPDGVYKLDTAMFNNAYYTLVPGEEVSAVSAQSVTTHKMTLQKKQVEVHIDSAVSTYGEDPFPYFSYNYGDGFEYGDTAEEVVYREPEFICVEKNGTRVGTTTQVGQYTISLTRPDAKNYNFHINTNKLTIEKRPLTITDITSGIPSLTADIIAANPGATHYIPAYATYSQMKSDRINNDNIRISYDAVYDSESPNSRYDVGITNIQLDESYGRNKNYTVDAANSVKTVVGGGKIFSQAVKSVKITEQPRLTYTYGEPLDLNSGSVHITYDTGAEGDIKFSELGEIGITLVYYDEATDKETGTVKNGDIITVNEHSGKKIKLKITSAYSIGSVYTDNLTVTKAAADISAITFSADNLSVSNKTNNITVTPPQMPDAMKKGGAKYEYSIDGGETWQESNVFTGLDTGTEYGVCVRFAATDNYTPSGASATASVTTYKNRLRIVKVSSATSETDDVLFTEYTNEESISTEAALKELVGSASAAYDKFYNDKSGKTATAFPYKLTANSTIYTSIKNSDTEQPSIPGNGGGGGGSLPTGTGPLVIKYVNKDGSLGEMVPSKIEVTTDTKLIKMVGDAGNIYVNIIWTTDNEEVATVDNGNVFIHGPGVVVIGAYVEGNKSRRSDMVTITVTDAKQPGVITRGMNIPYMTGYNGMIKPDDYMTRAEAATIMVKLAGDTGETYENIFPDVREGTWYKDIIAQAAARGLIAGYDDGNFYPEESVTREQFAAMVIRLAKIKPVKGQAFDDVEEGRWSAGSINAAVKQGIISGYSDGTFLPENPIRRSEAARMANAATGRIPDKKYIDAEVECPYSDLSKTHWAYYEFIIAAVEFELP